MRPEIQEAVAAGIAIQGWKFEEELAWMADQASRANVVLDVGCWRGRTTKTMASVCPGVVIAIDRLTGEYTGDTGRNEILKNYGSSAIVADFYRNMEKELHAQKVVCRFLNPPEVYWRVREFLGTRQADFAWIDGDHGYDDVKRDIVMYGRMIATGGILSGHDYESSFPGVVRAVNELCPGFERGPGTSWWTRMTPALSCSLGNLLAGR